MPNIDEATRKSLTKNIVFMNDETWPEYTKQDKITILHFLSSVDLVSRDQIPSIREFAAEHGEKYTVGVIDAGLCPNACEACRIESLPTMAVLRRNVLLGAYRGLFHEEDLPEFVLQLASWQQMNMDEPR